LPTIRIYPTFPAPTQDLKLDGKFEAKHLKKVAGRFYTDRSIEITSNNHKTFVEEDVATPKVLLFTNAKKGTPFVYKALSQNFEVSNIHYIAFISTLMSYFRKHYNSVWFVNLKKH